MAERVRLYVGTEWGLSVWCEGSGGWELFGPGIAPEPCRAIVGSPTLPAHVFAAVEHDGMYSTENGGWHWTRVRRRARPGKEVQHHRVGLVAYEEPQRVLDCIERLREGKASAGY